MRVSVCVVVKDRRVLMRRCLDAVLAQSPDEVVVVDNGSTDGTWEDLLERAAGETRMRVLQDTGSLGAIRNTAVRAATCDIVAFTDSDCRPLPGWLDAGLAALAAGGDVVQGKTVPEHKPMVRWSATQDLAGWTGLYEACNIFYRREVLLAAGGFDEQVGFFGEDTVAGWRVERIGGIPVWAADAVVEHVVTTPGFGWHLRRTRGYANWPALIKQFPEKRTLLWHGLFLRRRSAEVDLAAVGLLGAALCRRPRLMLAAAPLAWRHRPRGTSAGALLDAGSAVAFDVAISAALLRGSVRHATLVL